MGYPTNVVENAYTHSQIKTVEAVLGYLDAHPELNEAWVLGKSAPENYINQDLLSLDYPADNSSPFDDDSDEENQNKYGVDQHPGEQEISSFVNKQFRDNLIIIGYSRHPVEKALLLTGNVSINAAVDWIEENKDYLDFEYQLFIPLPDFNQSMIGENWTSKVATVLAKEAQKKLRASLLEKKDEIERRKIAELAPVSHQISEEMKKQRDKDIASNVNYFKKQKAEQDAAREKALWLIEKDKEARRGKPKPILKPALDIVKEIYQKMRTVYPKASISGPQVTVCLKTILIYLSKLDQALNSYILDNFLKDPARN